MGSPKFSVILTHFFVNEGYKNMTLLGPLITRPNSLVDTIASNNGYGQKMPYSNSLTDSHTQNLEMLSHLKMWPQPYKNRSLKVIEVFFTRY